MSRPPREPVSLPGHRPTLAALVACASLAFGVAAAAPESTTAGPPPRRDLADLLEPIRAKGQQPALAAAVVVGERIVASGAVGVRKVGSDVPVTLDDRFHLGSCTKAMTATMIARLVEAGLLEWTRTIGEAFPQRREAIDPAFHPVTLLQLLQHRSGLPEDRRPTFDLLRLRSLHGPMLEQRRQLVEWTLAGPPPVPPGVKMQYSNAGYAIAGAMAEAAIGATWEELMRQLLFDPLEMKSAGFGPPASPDETDQPWGHRKLGEETNPIPPGPLSDNPAVIGPSGTVHASIEDFARFAGMHLRGARGSTALLTEGSFRMLHTDALAQEYALGWVTADRPWARGPVLMHAGSNGLFHAVIVVAPRRDVAFVVASNSGGPAADAATSAALQALIAAYAPDSGTTPGEAGRPSAGP